MVIVHGNQDNNAKATILWDNAFSEMVRKDLEWRNKSRVGSNMECGGTGWLVGRHVQVRVTLTSPHGLAFVLLTSFHTSLNYHVIAP